MSAENKIPSKKMRGLGTVILYVFHGGRIKIYCRLHFLQEARGLGLKPGALSPNQNINTNANAYANMNTITKHAVGFTHCPFFD